LTALPLFWRDLTSSKFKKLPFPMTNCRIAGALLLLAALATAVSVAFRVAADADQPTLEQSFAAIGTATAAYAAGGAARVVSGLALLAAALPLYAVLAGYAPKAAWASRALLAGSGLATAVSGVCALILAAMSPESPSPGTVGATVEGLFAARWATGSLGFTLAGLGLMALAPAQWRVGGLLRVSAVVDAALGLAMLFIWVDAATAVHRATGIGFLLWLIITGAWLLAGLLKPQPVQSSKIVA